MTEQKIIEEIKRSTCFTENCNESCIYAKDKCMYRKIISDLEEIYLYKKGKLCLVPEDVYSKQCEELDAYKEIGNVEECREAVEKQKPKKIMIESYCSVECPTCGRELSESLGDGYYKYLTFLERCPDCGQVIQWEESEEE